MIKVLIIAESALTRQLVTKILSGDPYIHVVGTAPNASIAHAKIKKLNPDVLTLDVEMQEMDGLIFLRDMMRVHSMPVVIMSTLTEAGAELTLQALELGAVDYVTRPRINDQDEMRAYTREFISKVKIGARARINGAGIALVEKQEASPAAAKTHFKKSEMVIAMGASTGGTEALKEVLCRLSATTPGIVITQHIPVAFSKPFCERLNAHSAMTILMANDGQQVLPGHAYLAPGNRHLQVIREGTRFICKLLDSDPVNRHKPSVEVMFDSVARNVGPSALAVLLTGMGNDGSNAMGAIQRTGAATIAQDEATSVVWGMPGEAVKRGYADDVLPLNSIADRILYYISGHG